MIQKLHFPRPAGFLTTYTEKTGVEVFEGIYLGFLKLLSQVNHVEDIVSSIREDILAVSQRRDNRESEPCRNHQKPMLFDSTRFFASICSDTDGGFFNFNKKGILKCETNFFRHY